VGGWTDSIISRFTDAMLAVIRAEQPALVFIAWPNNPTGNLFDAAALERIIAAAPGIVVIDEAYHAFAQQSFMDRLVQYPNLLVMRTLSKSGLAGLRLGVLAGAPAWLAHIDKVRLPYNVNVLTQLAAEKVLQHDVLLDLHSFRAQSEPFVMIGPLDNSGEIQPFAQSAEERALARRLGVNRCVDGWLGTYALGVERRKREAVAAGRLADSKTEEEYHHIVSSDGTPYRGSWEEIVTNMRDADAEVLGEFLAGFYASRELPPRLLAFVEAYRRTC